MTAEKPFWDRSPRAGIGSKPNHHLSQSAVVMGGRLFRS